MTRRAVGEMMSYSRPEMWRSRATKEFVRAEIHAATTRFIIWTVGADTALLGLFVAITRAG